MTPSSGCRYPGLASNCGFNDTGKIDVSIVVQHRKRCANSVIVYGLRELDATYENCISVRLLTISEMKRRRRKNKKKQIDFFPILMDKWVKKLYRLCEEKRRINEMKIDDGDSDSNTRCIISLAVRRFLDINKIAKLLKGSNCILAK